MGQLLWDLDMDDNLAKLTCLFRKHFQTTDQAEQFWMELQTWKHKASEELQSLYNDICCLMSLAYPGPSWDLMNVVGHDAFLEALRKPAPLSGSWTRYW